MSLERFIEELHANECAFKLPAEQVQDLEDVVTVVIKLFLPKALEMIPDCCERFTVQEICNAGSHFERTKIKAPDEYDFMVVVKELSEPGAIKVEKGCKNGYARIKVIHHEKWGYKAPFQTSDKTFETAILQFNFYVRQALKLTSQLSPFRGYFGELRFKSILSRGKQYKEFSYVQTAYFRWTYKALPKKSRPDPDNDEGELVQRPPCNDINDVVSLEPSVSSAACQVDEHGSVPPDEVEIIYSRLDSLSKMKIENESRPFDEDALSEAEIKRLDLDIDLMTCCHVPLQNLTDILPPESLTNPVLSTNGCHIVLKPCGSPKCTEEGTPCRLLSYTKSEQELMRNLPANWKVVYKVFKWIFGYTEMLGIDSYKLKTAVLHLRYGHDKLAEGSVTSLDRCMISMWRFLKQCSCKGHMSSFFNPTLNVWNISSYYYYFVKWEVDFLYKIFDGINKTPLTEYDYDTYRQILEEWIIQFSRNNNDLKLLERKIDHSDFTDFCDQGNAFVDIITGMAPVLKKHKRFRYIAFQMKYRVLIAVLKMISLEIFKKVWHVLKVHAIPNLITALAA